MKTITKRITAFGVTGAAASALIVGGLVAPAQAAELDNAGSTVTDSSTSATSTQLVDDILRDAVAGNSASGIGILAPVASGTDTSVNDGGIANGTVVDGPLVEDSLNSDIGDVASGNNVANGIDAPIASGNGPVASGNDTSVSAPVTAPVDVPVDAPADVPVGSANDTDLGDVTGGDLGAEISDAVDSAVSDSLSDADLGAVDLGAVLGD
jgi:hypothetical protein